MRIFRKTKRKGRQAEILVAERVRGRLQPMSGANWLKPADIDSGKYLIETKHRRDNGYTITLATIRKLVNEAIGVGKIPLLFVVIGNIDSGDYKMFRCSIKINGKYGGNLSFRLTRGMNSATCQIWNYEIRVRKV